MWNFIVEAAAPYEETVHGIEIGGGLKERIGVVDGVPRLHWAKGSELGLYTMPFGLRAKALIGATGINRLCPLDEDQSWLDAHVAMDTLGAEHAYWERSEAQAGLQGGQYVVAQFNMTWVKKPGVTLKHVHLRPEINLPFLQSDWGLQISYCTGVARRVSLCEPLADIMSDLVEPLFQKPEGWARLNSSHDFVGALRGNNLKGWFDNLDKELQHDAFRIVRYVLLILQDTGIDRSGDYLVAIWPHRSDPLRCFKIPCKKATSWARMLADSPDCATFAYITPLCLETDRYQCQGLSAPCWHNNSVVLSTAVSRHVRNHAVTAAPWALKHEQSYLIGPSENALLGRVIRPSSPSNMLDPPSLQISSSMIPLHVQRRVIERIKERIREKQCSDVKAQGVMVVAGHRGLF